MTPAELDRCMETMVAAWPHYSPGPDTFRLLERLVGELTFEVVGTAIAEFSLGGREFAPPPGLLAQRCRQLASLGQTGPLPDASEALAEVYERIAREGVYRTPAWSHPALGQTIDALGGWEAVCMDDNPEAFRAHFMRLYETCRQRHLVPSLAGFAEPPGLAPGRPPGIPLPDLRAVRGLVS